MNSQVLVGGIPKAEDSFNKNSFTLEPKESLQYIKEFYYKIQEFEKERELLDLDKSQVETYKQLLLKQKDIMMTLTNKLNEKEEEIVKLKDEIEAYDKICM